MHTYCYAICFPNIGKTAVGLFPIQIVTSVLTIGLPFVIFIFFMTLDHKKEVKICTCLHYIALLVCRVTR